MVGGRNQFPSAAPLPPPRQRHNNTGSLFSQNLFLSLYGRTSLQNSPAVIPPPPSPIQESRVLAVAFFYEFRSRIVQMPWMKRFRGRMSFSKRAVEPLSTSSRSNTTSLFQLKAPYLRNVWEIAFCRAQVRGGRMSIFRKFNVHRGNRSNTETAFSVIRSKNLLREAPQTIFSTAMCINRMS